MTSTNIIVLATATTNLSVDFHGVTLETWHVGRALQWCEKHGHGLTTGRTKGLVVFNDVEYSAVTVIDVAYSYAMRDKAAGYKARPTDAVQTLLDLGISDVWYVRPEGIYQVA